MQCIQGMYILFCISGWLQNTYALLSIRMGASDNIYQQRSTFMTELQVVLNWSCHDIYDAERVTPLLCALRSVGDFRDSSCCQRSVSSHS